MRNSWLLLKVNIINTFKLNKIFKRKENRTSVFMSFLVIIGYISIAAVAFLYMFMFGELYSQNGVPNLILITGISIGFIFVLLMTITTANSYLFRSRDFDLLMALPVSSATVIFSKIVHLLLINYFMFLLIYLPTVVVYQIYNQTTPLFWLLVIPTFLLIPLLPIAVSGFLSFLFGFIPLKQKYKTILTIILSLFLVFIIFWSQLQISNVENPEAIFGTVGGYLTKINYPGLLAAEGMEGNILKYLLFVVISIIPFIGFVYIVAANYLKSNSRSRRSETNKKFVLTESESKGQARALIIKELRRYFSSSIYVVNTIMSPVISLIFLILLIMSKNQLAKFFEVLGYDVLPLIFIILLIFSLSLTSTTCSSISIEGKQFWILKSLPCQTGHIFFAKILVNLIITIPVLIIDVIVAQVALHITIVDALFLFIIPLLVLLYTSFIGLYSNLLLPRFDYENDTKVVKQSLSTLVAMVFGFFGFAILIGVGYVSYRVFETNLPVYLLTSLTALVLMIISFLLLRFHGTKLYQKIHP
ncbi:MAG: hypothetical protein PHV87_00210 [Bacilli bacterium]|nr:hypothetical protein [Bacilli bacterium]